MTFNEYIEYYNQTQPPFKRDGMCPMDRCKKCEDAYIHTYKCYGCNYAKEHYLLFEIDEDTRVMTLTDAMEIIECALNVASDESAISDADLSAAWQILNKALSGTEV